MSKKTPQKDLFKLLTQIPATPFRETDEDREKVRKIIEEAQAEGKRVEEYLLSQAHPKYDGRYR
jgi:hypothetical protein